MKKRLTLHCWHCEREYEMTREIGDNPQLIVACPYCLKEGVVDLEPDRDPAIPLYKAPAAPGASVPEPTAFAYILPPVLPTRPRANPSPDTHVGDLPDEGDSHDG